MPAQRSAGVIKSFKGKEMKMEEILKSIYTEKDINLSGEECKKLCSYIDELKKSAADGVYYRDSLTSEVLRLSAVVQPDISRETMESVAKSMSVVQLKEFKMLLKKGGQHFAVGSPALQTEERYYSRIKRQF